MEGERRQCKGRGVVRIEKGVGREKQGKSVGIILDWMCGDAVNWRRRGDSQRRRRYLRERSVRINSKKKKKKRFAHLVH